MNMEEALQALQLPHLKDWQLQALQHQLRNESVFICQKTGAGKSAVFQMAALMKHGCMIVFQPLLILMHEQVKKLKDLKIPVEHLEANIGNTEKNENTLRQIGNLKMIFMSPEKLNFNTRVQQVLEKAITDGLISRVIVDEAHIPVLWGMTFRPSYLKMLVWFQQRHLPITFLSASATEEMIDQILNGVQLPREECFIQRGSVYRENLHLYCRKVKDSNELDFKILDVIQQHFVAERKRTVIFCLSKKEVTYYRDLLDEKGIISTMYHADYSEEEKKLKLRFWLRIDKPSVLVTTVAFSMGVDVKDITTVVHTSLPPDLASWYQEIR